MLGVALKGVFVGWVFAGALVLWLFWVGLCWFWALLAVLEKNRFPARFQSFQMVSSWNLQPYFT